MTMPSARGRAARIEHEYTRGGAWAYLAALDVHRAKVFGRCEMTTGIEPFDRLVAEVMSQPLIQPRWARRCGSDGVYLTDTDPPYLKAVSAPTRAELQALVQRISERIGRHLGAQRPDSGDRRRCGGNVTSYASELPEPVIYVMALSPPRQGRKRRCPSGIAARHRSLRNCA
jgi:hypothetical protein